MAHEYSVMIHTFIGEKIVLAEQRKQAAGMRGDLNAQRFYEGQLAELMDTRKYLAERVDLRTQRYF
jgi:hypothetical protein